MNIFTEDGVHSHHYVQRGGPHTVPELIIETDKTTDEKEKKKKKEKEKKRKGPNISQ